MRGTELAGLGRTGSTCAGASAVDPTLRRGSRGERPTSVSIVPQRVMERGELRARVIDGLRVVRRSRDQPSVMLTARRP